MQPNGLLEELERGRLLGDFSSPVFFYLLPVVDSFEFWSSQTHVVQTFPME